MDKDRLMRSDSITYCLISLLFHHAIKIIIDSTNFMENSFAYNTLKHPEQFTEWKYIDLWTQ